MNKPFLCRLGLHNIRVFDDMEQCPATGIITDITIIEKCVRCGDIKLHKHWRWDPERSDSTGFVEVTHVAFERVHDALDQPERPLPRLRSAARRYKGAVRDPNQSEAGED